MAEGILTALQAALSGLGGGIEGAAQYREMERRRQKEEEATRRQTRLDEAAIRAEQRQAAASGMVQRDAYNPSGIAGGMDMPGATPRKPAFSQNIGGTEFVLPESPVATKHRELIAGKIDARNKEQAGRTALTEALASVDIGGKRIGGDLAKSLGALDPNTRASVIGAMRESARAAARGTTATRATAAKLPSSLDTIRETDGLKFLKDNARNPEVIAAVEAAITDDPRRAERPGLIGYGLMKSQEAANKKGRGRATRVPKSGEAPPGYVPTAKGGAATPANVPAQKTPTQKAPARDELDDAYDRFINKKG